MGRFNNKDSRYSSVNEFYGEANEPVTRKSGDASANGKDTRRVVLVGLLAVALLAVSLWVFFANFTLVGSMFNYTICSRKATELDFTGNKIQSLKGVERCSELRLINALELELDEAETAAIQAAMPQCEILWKVRICGTEAEASTTRLTLSETATPEDIKKLVCFPDLVSVDATACSSSCYAALFEVSQQLPDCDIDWVMTVCGQTLSAHSTEVSLDSSATPEDIKLLQYFPDLQTVSADNCAYMDELEQVEELLPEGCVVSAKVTIAGVETVSGVEELDISNCQITDFDAFFDQLAMFKRLKKIDMCGCGLTDEQMSKLCESYPNTKFVWIVKVATWELRTDTYCFSTLNHGKMEWNQNDFENLKYCTDLVALDLGHNSISDLSFLAPLKNLKALILMENDFTDITPLKELTSLNWLELYNCQVSDVSALAEMPSLQFVNLSKNKKLKDFDFSVFHNCDQLRQLWLMAIYIPTEVTDSLKDALPNCKVNTKKKLNQSDCGEGGWCWTYHFEGYRRAFRNWENVTFMSDFSDVEYNIDDSKLLQPKLYYYHEIYHNKIFPVETDEFTQKYIDEFGKK